MSDITENATGDRQRSSLFGRTNLRPVEVAWRSGLPITPVISWWMATDPLSRRAAPILRQTTRILTKKSTGTGLSRYSEKFSTPRKWHDSINAAPATWKS